MIRSYSIYSVVALVPSPGEWAPVVGAAAIAGLAALVSTIAATVRGPRERRRELYSQAFKDAMAWQEGLYRVRRRDNTAAQEGELIGHFHDLQERIAHHRAWLASESIYLARSYCDLVDHIKKECKEPLQKAWDEDGRPPGADHTNETHPQGIEEKAGRFLLDVRLHLWSSLLLPSLIVAWRNRKGRKS